MTTSPAAGARAALAVVGAAVLVALAAPFFAATTFVGDDHLFLAFARYVPNPLVAFVRDQHGGEYYRPLPMSLWWVLGRLGGGSPLPFAVAAVGLHVAVAALLGALLVALGRPRATAAIAAGLFVASPQNLEAAYWYAASADLLAAAFGLASLLALARNRIATSAILTAAACLSKEPALVLPALGLVVIGARSPSGPAWPRRLLAVAPQAVVAVVVGVLRHHVLRGWGGAGDSSAPPAARFIQLGGGLVHVWTGSGVLPDWMAWSGGVVALVALLAATARRARRQGRATWAPIVFCLVALAPAVAAGWIVGARYFYFPAAGLAWAAAEALAPVGAMAVAAPLATLLALGGVQASARWSQIRDYEARLAAARSAVAAGVAQGHRAFHVACGIKDLDLAVKEDPALARLADRILVLGDVPASFAIPPDLAPAAAMLVAQPPLPPSGAYEMGGHRIVGLARRDADPDLGDVVHNFPDLRFIRVRSLAGGAAQAHDVTDEVRRKLDDGRPD